MNDAADRRLAGESPLLDARVAVTGAGRGIGRALAAGFAAAGADLALLARGREDLDETAGRVRRAGRRALVLPTDVTNARAVDRSFAAIGEDLQGLDVLVVNAGTNRRKPLSETSDADWRAVLGTNLDGAFFCCRAALPLLREGGRILLIGSVAGHVAIPTGVAYAASKGAIEQMTRALAQELGPRRIAVNCIAPWYFRTPLTEALLDDPAYVERILAETPMHTLGPMEELVALAIHLAGPAAGWITGQVVSVDGGFSTSRFHPPHG